MSNNQLKVYYIDSSIASNNEIKFFETPKSAWLNLAKQLDTIPADLSQKIAGFWYGDTFRPLNTEYKYITGFWGGIKKNERTFLYGNYRYANHVDLIKAVNEQLSSIEMLIYTYTLKELVLGSPVKIRIPTADEVRGIFKEEENIKSDLADSTARFADAFRDMPSPPDIICKPSMSCHEFGEIMDKQIKAEEVLNNAANAPTMDEIKAAIKYTHEHGIPIDEYVKDRLKIEWRHAKPKSQKRKNKNARK